MKSNSKGVYWHKTGKKWVAEIWIKGEKCYLGLFQTIAEAVKAREEKFLKSNGGQIHQLKG
jgi:hypothetical protein